jgi:hypothetical protein
MLFHFIRSYLVTACNGRLGMQFFFIYFKTMRLPKMKSNQDSGLPGLGVLDETYSAKPAQQCSHTGPPGYMDTVPAYVYRRAFTATPLSGLS